jgi:hypothetical protein
MIIARRPERKRTMMRELMILNQWICELVADVRYVSQREAQAIVPSCGSNGHVINNTSWKPVLRTEFLWAS